MRLSSARSDRERHHHSALDYLGTIAALRMRVATLEAEAVERNEGFQLALKHLSPE